MQVKDNTQNFVTNFLIFSFWRYPSTIPMYIVKFYTFQKLVFSSSQYLGAFQNSDSKLHL